MTDQNKRATKGTEHTLTTGQKIGGEFKKEKDAAFIAERAKVWDDLFAKQQEAQKNLPKEKITITLKDGKTVEGTSNETTPADIGKKHMSNQIWKEIIVAKVIYSKRVNKQEITSIEDEEEKQQCVEKTEEWDLWDLYRPLEGDCRIEFCSFEEKEGKSVFWHSSAHVLGYAMEKSFGCKLCIGPALEEGFYYDGYMGTNVIESGTDFKILEDEVKKLCKGNHPYQRLTMTKKDALELFKANPFKVQLITSKIADDGYTTAYRCGDFIDLCLGPHVPNMNCIKSFKCTKNSATNWLAKVNNDTLQRVYGISFPSEKLMKEYIQRKEDEEKRDHRNIGKQHSLFMFHNLSPGSCFFYGLGAHIYNKLVEFMREEYLIRGYTEVISPNIFNLKLWKTSGHYKNYKENLFLMKVENQGFGLKPMNCPGHCLMFDSIGKSYKELPLRFADFGVLHRNEISGALTGLTRVRRFQQDDAHIFCTYDQIMDEVFGVLDFIEYVYSVFGFEYELYLSTRPAKMLGDAKLWDMAEKALEDALNKFGKPWKINPGDGAFYGPKIDIKLFDALKRTHQCGTIQLDFQLPIRFNLSYRTDEQVPGEKKEKDGEDKKKKKEKKKKGDKKEGEEEKKEEEKKEEKKEEAPKNREVYPKDEWDDEEFVWEEQQIKPGFKRPCMVHRAILGSVERFIAIITEQYAGKFPFWLSPKQVYVCCISDKFNEWGDYIELNLRLKGYQVYFDKNAATLQKKVRNAQLEQWNYIAVIGQEEVDGKCVDLRNREGERCGKYTLEKLLTLFESLQPPMSKKKKELMEKAKINVGKIDPEKTDKIAEINSKLTYNLFLNGDEISEDDKKTYEEIKDTDINKELFPNAFKWKKLVASQMK